MAALMQPPTAPAAKPTNSPLSGDPKLLVNERRPRPIAAPLSRPETMAAEGTHCHLSKLVGLFRSANQYVATVAALIVVTHLIFQGRGCSEGAAAGWFA